MKYVRVLILAGGLACAVGAPVLATNSNHTVVATNPNGPNQNGNPQQKCQNGTINPTTGKCINNQNAS